MFREFCIVLHNSHWLSIWTQFGWRVSRWKSISNVNIRLSETSTKQQWWADMKHLLREAFGIHAWIWSVSGSRWNLCKDTIVKWDEETSSRSIRRRLHRRLLQICTWIASSIIIINKRCVYISSYYYTWISNLYIVVISTFRENLYTEFLMWNQINYMFGKRAQIQLFIRTISTCHTEQPERNLI